MGGKIQRIVFERQRIIGGSGKYRVKQLENLVEPEIDTQHNKDQVLVYVRNPKIQIRIVQCTK